jgi:hypothetical protein
MSDVNVRLEIKDGSREDDAAVEKKQTKYQNNIPINELWSLDETLTEYLLPRISAFRKMERHGYPVLDEECISKQSRQQQNGDEDLRAAADWENILYDIEKGFEAHRNLIGYGEEPGATEENEKIMQKGLNLFAKYYGHLWD